MRKLLAITILLVSVPAFAQEPVVESEKVPETRIEVDEEASEIRFIIDGIEQARLTSDGLKVRGNIEYGETLRDAGGDIMEKSAQEVK
ncbi:hypothetical protein [Hasllibacter halocynthiae]|uniref:hypothetical protein n=1 Tax=Hasllibacter halocynthiae TaxID=595589 RepID=UPI0011B22E0C|nr:hypothetical protein [Hasllibacter halocynthiae]